MDTSRNVETLTTYKEKWFHRESDKTLEQVTQRDCGIPDLGGVQDAAGHSPEQGDSI